MVIKQRRISMRASDFHLNANQILSAGTSDRSKRTKLLAKLKSRGVESKNLEHEDDIWVSFTDGVFLCQAVELEKDLKFLFSHSSLSYPDRDKNYLFSRKKRPCLRRIGYATISCEDHSIAYRSAERTVNAPHFLRLRNISRNKLMNFFKANPKINKNIRSGHPSVSENYISFENALILCTYFGINSEPVRDLIVKDDSISNDKIDRSGESSV